MKLESSKHEKHLEKDLKTFSELPPETRELHVLLDQEQKTIGKAKADVHEAIEEKSD